MARVKSRAMARVRAKTVARARAMAGAILNNTIHNAEDATIINTTLTICTNSHCDGARGV